MPRYFPPHRNANPAATGAGVAKHIRFTIFRKAVFSIIQITMRSIVVRARHVVTAGTAYQLAAAGFQPLRARWTIPGNILDACYRGSLRSNHRFAAFHRMTLTIRPSRLLRPNLIHGTLVIAQSDRRGKSGASSARGEASERQLER